MKSIKLFLILCLLAIGYCNAQSTDLKQKDSTKQMNLLDEQVNVLGSIFSTDPTVENPFKGATNYLELLEKSDLPKTQKEELKEQYKLYDLSLDPRKKDSLSLVFNKKLKDAMDKSTVEP